MTDAPTPTCPTPDEMDRVARMIAAAVWSVQPDMSGDIWKRLGVMQRRVAEMAALSAIQEVRRGSPVPNATTRRAMAEARAMTKQSADDDIRHGIPQDRLGPDLAAQMEIHVSALAEVLVGCGVPRDRAISILWALTAGLHMEMVDAR